MTHRTALTCLTVFFMTLTSGCGGGGGGGGDTSPPPPPGGDTQAAFTTQNATLVAAVGNAFLESFVQLTLSSLDNVFDLSDSGELTASIDCAAPGGSVSATLLDNDGSGVISDGDRVELNYSNCLQNSLGDVVSGRINVEIVGLTITSDLSTTGDFIIRIPASLSFNDGSIEVNGVYRVSWFGTPSMTLSAGTENLDISTSGTESLRIVIRDGSTTVTEVAQQVTIGRRIASDSYRITGSFNVSSGTVDGTFSCSVSEDIVGNLQDLPNDGTLTCTGRSNSRVRVAANSSGSISTEVDPEGDGSFVNAGVTPGGNGLWSDYVEGQLFSAMVDGPSRIPSTTPPDATSVSLAINVFDAAYDAVNGLLYVSSDTGLAVVDVTTMTQVDAVAIADRPGPLAISDDGSTVWVGLRDTSEIVPVDAATLGEGTRVALGNSVSFGQPRLAKQLRVAPGTADTVVVVSEITREVVAFQGGTALPNVVNELGAPTIIEFQDATTIVGVNDATTIFAATLMSLDANGLTLTRNLREYSTNFNITMTLDGGIAWTSAGRAIDVANELVLGRVDFDQFGNLPFAQGVYLDPADDRVWFYSDGANKLRFFERDTFRALGEYDLPTNGDMIRMLGASGSNVLLVLDTEVHRVDLSVLGPTAVGQVCTAVDLGGQLGAAVYLAIECLFNDAVYDAARDLIYASIPSAVGRNGNSVAIISPQTGLVLSYVYVGSEPDRLSISGGGTRLYVTLQESNRLAVVDLASQSLTDMIRLEDDATFGAPGFAVALAASTQIDTDVAVANDDTLAVYSNGARLAAFDPTARNLETVFFTADASRVYAIDDSNRLWRYDAGASGLTFVERSASLLQFLGAKIKNDILYDRIGAIVDPATATVVANCPPTNTFAVEPDPASSDVFYLQTGFDSVFQVCDRDTLSITTTFTIPRFGSSFFQPSLTKAGSNRIAITNSDKMLLLDPNEF